MLRWSIIPILLLALFPPGARAADLELTQFSPWHVDWTDHTCLMRRGFGSKDEPTLLQFERFAPGPGFQLLITSDRLRFLETGDRLRIAYGDGPSEEVIGFMLGKNGSGIPTVFIGSSSLRKNISDFEIAADGVSTIESQVSSITLSWNNNRLKLITGALDKPFEALRSCTDDLVKTWGLDPQVQKTLTRRVDPLTSPGDWLKSPDYPRSALRRGGQAIVNFRLTVDALGVPSDCEVQRSYSGDDFDDRTCVLLMQRARFKPAINIEGNAVESFYAHLVKYVIR